MQFKISGTVKEKESGRVLSGLGVKPVLDSRALHSRFCSLLGETNTDENGDFAFSYQGEEYAFLLESEAKFYLEIFTARQEQPIHRTECRQFEPDGGVGFDIEISREELMQSFPRDGEMQDMDSAVTSLERESAFSDAIEAKVYERVKARMASVNERAKAAKQAFANFSLSRLSPEQQKEITYLRPGDDLAKTQQKVIEQDLE